MNATWEGIGRFQAALITSMRHAGRPLSLGLRNLQAIITNALDRFLHALENGLGIGSEHHPERMPEDSPASLSEAP
jgi:hypothetical protein